MEARQGGLAIELERLIELVANAESDLRVDLVPRRNACDGGVDCEINGDRGSLDPLVLPPHERGRCWSALALRQLQEALAIARLESIGP